MEGRADADEIVAVGKKEIHAARREQDDGSTLL